MNTPFTSVSAVSTIVAPSKRFTVTFCNNTSPASKSLFPFTSSYTIPVTVPLGINVSVISFSFTTTGSSSVPLSETSVIGFPLSSVALAVA